VQDVLDIGKLVLAAPGGAANAEADFRRRDDDRGEEENEDPSQASAQHHDEGGGENQGEGLLQKFGKHAGESELDALDIVDDGREQSAGSVLLKESRRAPEDGAVHVVAQVGDGAEARVADQIGARVVEHAL
jgi:hypothetical protein